ncbi:MAG TPA: ABC transporter permease [Acidimicrobiales bacterium]|nr:ABC transporter permease [Acidimicrobiales bacterium]
MRAVLRRLPPLIATLLAVSFLTFLLTSLLPGDPAEQILGPQSATPERLAAVRAELRLDDALPVRYVRWLGDAATGDLGRSYRTNQQVRDAIIERLPVTVQIGGMAIGFALLVAVPLGMISAYRSGGPVDRVVTGGSFMLLSIPSFMMALVLILVFAVNLGWLPATGWTRISDDLGQNLRAALLPAASLAVGELAVYTRLLRSDMIGTLQEDYIALARAKGMPTFWILLRHALRPSSFSLLTVVGLQVGAVMTGSVVIETLFALPGVGRLLVDSVYQRDLIMVQGIALVVAVSYVLVNFIVDIVYSYLDPRIRHGRTAART